MATVSKLSQGNSHNRHFVLLIERLECLDRAKAAIYDEVADVYAEAKRAGYDRKLLRQIVRVRNMTAENRAAIEALLDPHALPGSPFESLKGGSDGSA